MQNNDCRVESVERPRSLAPGAPGERVIDRTAGARGAVVPACTNALIATCIRSNCARLPNAALAQRSRGPAIMTRLALRLVGKIFNISVEHVPRYQYLPFLLTVCKRQIYERQYIAPLLKFLLHSYTKLSILKVKLRTITKRFTVSGIEVDETY